MSKITPLSLVDKDGALTKKTRRIIREKRKNKGVDNCTECGKVHRRKRCEEKPLTPLRGKKTHDIETGRFRRRTGKKTIRKHIQRVLTSAKSKKVEVRKPVLRDSGHIPANPDSVRTLDRRSKKTKLKELGVVMDEPQKVPVKDCLTTRRRHPSSAKVERLVASIAAAPPPHDDSDSYIDDDMTND
jgi:hypothetical protein